MRRLRWLLTVLVLVASIRWVPSTWCQRDAGDLWNDEAEVQQRLAGAADHWRATMLSEDRLMTGSALFDGEWLFGTYMMAALGYLQSAQAQPERRAEYLAAADDCVDRMITADVRRFDRVAWSTDPLEDLGTHRAHAAYLGYLNLVLSLRRVIAADSPHAELNDRVSAHLAAELARSPRGVIETYPGQVFPVDNTAVVASLSLHERATGIGHAAAVSRWDENFESFRDRDSGLLIQAVGYRDAQPRDEPRGSGTGLAAYFLSFSNPAQSRTLYTSMRDALHRTVVGFGAMREYPEGTSGDGDIDSGPLVLGLSISSTGFALAASRAHGDEETFTSLWATTYLFGAPVDRDGATHFAFGGPLGDAMMFALLTARPAEEWSALT